MPDSIRCCIESWKRVMPDYHLRLWDANSFDFESVPFVKEAYSRRKWAFMSDYVRLYACYTEGGIYLDSDVRVFKAFDELLTSKMFIGTEIGDAEHHSNLCIDGAIFGAEAGHPFLRKCLDFYQALHFIQPDGSYNNTPQPRVITPIAIEEGYCREDKLQHLNNDLIVYPTSFFTHICDESVKDSVPDSLYALHLLNHSWIDVAPGFTFCKRYHIAWLFPVLKPIILRLRLLFPQNNKKKIKPKCQF